MSNQSFPQQFKGHTEASMFFFSNHRQMPGFHSWTLLSKAHKSPPKNGTYNSPSNLTVDDEFGYNIFSLKQHIPWILMNTNWHPRI